MSSNVSGRTRMAVTAGRVTGWLSRVSGRGQGATVSGRVMNRLAPNALTELAHGQHVTLVSATNGKTTTTKLLVAVLEAAGKPVISNATGANLTSGIAPILARAPGPGIAVLEVDERVVRRVVDPLQVEHLVLGNLSRDQLDRYGEVHAVGDQWRTVCETHPDLRVVANASDPHIVWAAGPAKTTWVTLGAGWRNDAATCPSCGALLEWTVEAFRCPTCDFAPPETANRLDGDTLVLDGTRVPLQLALPGRWNLANAALAVTAAVTEFDVDPSIAASAVASVHTVAGRYTTVRLADGRDAHILLAKNPAGWSEVLQYLAGTDSAVVIAVNARVADGKDPSWLWDVPYELLRGHAVASAGDRCLDVAVRLQYADIDAVVEPDPLRAALRITGNTVHIVASYTQFSALYRKFGR
jgi:lipid II isoglutaminyl synthase (glutamine-hydrolysing)